MDDLISKLPVADKPQFTEITPELRSERNIGSGGCETVFKESWNRTKGFTEKSKISPSDLQSERKIGSGSFGSVFKEALNTTEIFTEISPSELQLERKIGSGGFGTVFKGLWNKTEVAIKVFKLEGNIKPRQAAIQKEVETWAKLRHPHVLLFLGADIKGEVPFVVMPYLKNGNAREFIERHPECNRNKILHDVTLALIYLHRRNVVHGDIKGFNVLIDIARNAVLCDFGIASIKDDVLSTSLNSGERSISGTPSFMAPERLKGGSLRKPSDVYAFGMLVYEVHANTNPLNLHVGYSEFVKLVAIEGYRPERPDRDEAPQITDDIWDLAERCWAGTASARPSIDDVCDIVAPSVKLFNNHPSSTVPREGPERNDRDEAPRLTDDTLCVAESRSESTPSAKPSIQNIGDGVAPSVELDRNYPANTVPRSEGPSTPVPSSPPSAYDRLRAGATFREAFAIRTPCQWLTASAMTHDSKTIASSGNEEGGKDLGTIHTWDSTSGALSRSLQGHTDRVACLSFFQNGSLVSGSWDRTVRVWDLASSATVILEHNSEIACISLSADNKTIATGVSDDFVRLWDATTGNLMHTLKIPKCTAIHSISISSDTSFLVALGYDRSRLRRSVAALWKQQPDGQWAINLSREFPWNFKNDFSSYTSCSSSGFRFAFSKDGRLITYDLRKHRARVDEGGGVVEFSPDGNWLVGRVTYETGERAFKIWDAANGNVLSELLSRKSLVTTVFVSHDGSTILVGDGVVLRVLTLTDS